MRVVSADWVVPVEGDPIPDGAVSIGDDGRIASVGPVSELGRGERFEGCVITPGFVDCHTHLEYAVYAGFGDGLPFSEWIGLHVARKRLLDLDDMVAIATDGAHECLRSGITTVGDCSFAGAAAEAAALTGLRAIVYLEVFGQDDSAFERFAEMRERVAPLASDRLRIGISPHAPYTCTLDLYAACAALDLPTATHLAESVSERRYLVDGAGDWSAFAHMLVPPPGTTGIRMLADAGLLGPHLLAAHCVDVDDDEIALLADHGVGVAHCPRSNGILGCGVAPIGQLTEAGIAVGIATDSPASTPSFDLFDELRAAIVAARARAREPGGALRRAGTRARDDGRRAGAGPRARDRLARAREVGRPGRDLPRRLAVRPGRGARNGGRPGRFAGSGCSYSRSRRGPLPERLERLARYQKSRPKGTKPHASVAPARPRPRAQSAPSLEDTMFFPRLRRHAKWMFVLLALFFAFGFVLFGVGAGGVGVGDIFRGSGTTGVQSVDDARGKTEDRPKDPTAWRDLATALQTEGETEEAITALNTAVALAPKDGSAYRELAGLHLTLATERQRDAQFAQAISIYRAASQSFPPLLGTAGQGVYEDPIARGVSAIANERVTTAYQDASTQATLAVDAYEELAALEPDDPNTQLELAQAAQQTGDATTAIAAYERFLKLAPDDPSASVVRDQLKQLRASLGG